MHEAGGREVMHAVEEEHAERILYAPVGGEVVDLVHVDLMHRSAGALSDHVRIEQNSRLGVERDRVVQRFDVAPRQVLPEQGQIPHAMNLANQRTSRSRWYSVQLLKDRSGALVGGVRQLAVIVVR